MKETSGERSTRGSSSRATNCFEPRAARGERKLAQILLAVGEQIVGAQMRGKLGHEFGRDGFAIEPLLQHVERLHAALAHDQKLAVDRARQAQRIEKIGKALGNILAGARIEPRDRPAVCRAATACTRMPSHFHSAMNSAGSSAGEVRLVERMRQHRRPERRRIAARRLFRRGLRARRTARRKAAPGRARAARYLAHRWRRAPRPRPWRAAPKRRCATRR